MKNLYPIHDFHSPFHRKNAYSPADSMPPPPHATAWTPTKSILFIIKELLWHLCFTVLWK